jgi:uncharacterized protein (DUF1330 family)
VGSGFPKDHAEIVFQLPDPGGDVGLHTMQPFRRARHAAIAHDGTGDAQIGQFDISLQKIEIIIIIHFIGCRSPRKDRGAGDWFADISTGNARRARMAKAYWIVRVSVRNEQRYPEYLAAAAPAFQKFGARFIVRGGAFETMEGSARERNVVVEFADRTTAFACYESPEYRSARAIRQKYADTDFIIVEGVAD